MVLGSTGEWEASKRSQDTRSFQNPGSIDWRGLEGRQTELRWGYDLRQLNQKNKVACFLGDTAECLWELRISGTVFSSNPYLWGKHKGGTSFQVKNFRANRIHKEKLTYLGYFSKLSDKTLLTKAISGQKGLFIWSRTPE